MQKIPVRSFKNPVNEPELSGSFNIRKLGPLLTGSDMIQELHRHDFFFVLVIEKGKGEHIIDFTSYPITGHSVFFMRPGQVHQLTLKKGSSGYLLEFKNDFYSPARHSANQLLRKVSSKNYCRPGSKRFKELIAVLDKIFNEFTSRQEKYFDVIKANMEIFFIELSRQSPNPGGLTNETNLYTQERLEELMQLLELNIYTKKQVSDYADMMHLTSYQLNTITKKLLGKTCSAVIDDHIILEAKRQLLATSEQVNQVADQLGYEDPSYFIRFFKKHTGYSPEAFRKNFK
ncbi:MAG TPA: helix-turn-helix transcriptional regulator [Chitinophagaceae bacterium]|nr:helix-turn-helix transcriptional regulator [Chitinophagaceae bacterium]